MTRKLLTTTALVALLTSGAFADNHTSVSTDLNIDANAQVSTPVSKDQTKIGVSGGSTTTVDMMATNSTAKAMNNAAMTMSGDAVLASNLLGKKVYSSSSADAEVYGDINDVVMDSNGNAEWIIVGVGGFLGIGEKEVALSVNQIDWIDRDGERVVVTSLAKTDLEIAAEFDRDALTKDGKYTDRNFSWTEEGKRRYEGLKNWDWEHAQLETIAYADISAEQLIGARVQGPDREDIGEVGDVLLLEGGEVTAYIIDVGGFLGLGEKPVALSTDRVHIYQNADGDLSVRSDFTKEELENGPTYKKDEYTNNPDGFIIK